MADDHGDTPLHLAAGSGDGECVEALLQLGHSVIALNQLGRTPMGVARGRAKAVLAVRITRNKISEEPGIPTPPSVAGDENMTILEGPDAEGEYVALVGFQHSNAPLSLSLSPSLPPSLSLSLSSFLPSFICPS
jgi:ankyrin repeat protein